MLDVLGGTKKMVSLRLGGPFFMRGGRLCVATGRPRPIWKLKPRIHQVPPDHHGIFEWFIDAMECLVQFVHEVVEVRKEKGVQFSSVQVAPSRVRPSSSFLLPPQFFLDLPSLEYFELFLGPCSACLIDAQFGKAWMPSFCWEGRRVVTIDAIRAKQSVGM